MDFTRARLKSFNQQQVDVRKILQTSNIPLKKSTK